jgi:hypothetical protein
MRIYPEHKSIEAFVEFLRDDERDVFDHRDLAALNYATRRRRGDIRRELEALGFKLAVREPGRRVRGFDTSSNDRYWGPGSERTYASSGWEQISGFAGQEGH